MPRPAQIDLEHAVVAITGAARGIGRACAEEFARRGATVCLADRDGDAAALAASEIGIRAHPFTVDVRSRESFEEFLAAAHASAGPLDVLVNNAGVMPNGAFLAEPEEATNEIIAVNLMGPMHGMQLALPGMIARGRGHVVNVASMLGKLEVPGLASYIASKHAVVGLSAGVRSELRRTGVTVSTVLPSVVDTQLTSGIRIPGIVARIAQVRPEDVASAIVGTCEDRPGEVAVPRWLGYVPVVRPLIPGWLEHAARRLLGDDAALRSAEAPRGAPRGPLDPDAIVDPESAEP